MGNSSPQSDLITGSYVHELTVADLPVFSHPTVSSKSAWGSGIKMEVPKVAGYICITPDFKVPTKTKPNPRHLYNMKKTFGWKWEDV